MIDAKLDSVSAESIATEIDEGTFSYNEKTGEFKTEFQIR